MANRGEALFQQGVIEAMTDHGWKAGTTFGYDRKGEDVSELELTRYRLTKREEKCLRLEDAEGDYGLTSVSDVRSGKPQDPEKQRLAEIIDRLNDLYGTEFSDESYLHFANGIERDEAVMAQVRNHSEDQVIHSHFPKRVG